MNEKELRELLDFSVTIARDAGEITRRYFRKTFGTYHKSNKTLVTDADLEGERYLRRAIEERYPDDAILGEEEGERKGTSGRRWILDPIDGTYSFVHGVPFYGVLIGIEVDGEPTVGVVEMPALGETLYAARGIGCSLNGEPARVSTTATLEDALLLATDFGVCESYGFGRAADELERQVAARRTWGDCYGYVLVATGRADIMFDPVMNVWDCAALLPVMTEAGGTFTDWRGRASIHGGNAIATNGLLFEQVMKIVESSL
jgi:histidinol phosphatase-like enzyme (inositol monophosphatase family)